MSQITKRALEQSLKNLLLKKPLTKITVSDITEDCSINRMTFYYHFKDIYDLVEWSCAEDARQALESKQSYDTWQEELLQIFQVARENKPFLLNVYRCVHQERVETYLRPQVEDLVRKEINLDPISCQVSDADKDFIARIYCYVLVGAMLDWIKQDMQTPPEEIVEKLGIALCDTVGSLLNRFSVSTHCLV